MRIADAVVTMISYLKQPVKRAMIREAYTFRSKRGIEIGGPSAFFGLKGGFPVYLFAEKIDNVNYGTNTFYGDYEPGETFNYYRKKIGHQFIAEATDLSEIGDGQYDFLLSSHSLEHTANPLKALKEWFRILKPNGKLILILPDKRYTFDKSREYTSFSHLIDDYENDRAEDDTTHIEEILSTFDEEVAKVKIKDYKLSLGDILANRSAHHHVFSQEMVKTAAEFVGFKVQAQYETPPFHLITIATK
jgi:predicted SAM-dependent methyltransferase